jgi:eukaryotic-like serine/threonine-protein kinase
MSLAGTRLGGYEILALIGAGGMGEVYRARDTKLHRDVAIKILPAAFAADPERLARFEREARLLASLSHPHIAQIHGVEGTSGVAALVLELVEGETLAERIAGGPKRGPARSRGRGLPVDEAVAIARQIADALDAAHERGIVHRDLKPANVVVGRDGTVKVLDFGLATERSAAVAGGRDFTHAPTVAEPTDAGALLGTTAYMSPEQARGMAVDKRTDVWAFGCLLFEMLTGRRAFAGETTSDIVAAILEREPDWSALPASTPPHVRRLLQRTLDRDPKSRLRDIADARADLAAPPGAPIGADRTAPRAARRLAVAWAAFAVMTAVAAALAVAAFRARTTVPDIEFETMLPSDLPSNFAQLAMSPDGRQLVVAPTFDGHAPLWVRPLGSIAGHTLPGTEGAIFPFWSPDGSAVAFFADRKLKRIALDSEVVEVVADVGVPRGGAWKSDGTILLAPNLTNPIFRVPASGGTPIELTHLEPGQNDHRAPFLLPGEQHFLYYARGTPQVRGVYVARIDGSERHRLLDADAAAVYASGHLLFPRQGELFAQAFDPKRLALGGSAFRVAPTIAVNAGVSLASLAASSSGAVAYGKAAELRTQVIWFDRSGKRLAPLGAPDITSVANPALSPDGRQLAFSNVTASNWDIWSTDDRGATRRLTSDPALDFFPVWSADGRRVIFQSTRGKAADLYSISLNDGVETLLLTDERSKSPTDVSPDGRFLLFNAATASGLSDVWLLELSGGRASRPLVQTRFDDREAQFSPDGKWIAYQSSDSGRAEIYVQPFPGPGDRTQVSIAGGTQVRWGRRGLELLYVTVDQRLMSVAASASADGAIRLGAPVPMFRTSFDPSALQGRQQYVLSADNQRVLMNVPVAGRAPSPIVVLPNWKPR